MSEVLPGVSRLICVASKEFPRYSEADVIELRDGRLLLALGRKSGAGDFAQSSIIGRISRDHGVSWDEPWVILEPFEDVSGIYSVGLCRSPRGVHMFFLARGPDAHNDTRIYQIISSDEGKTWSTPAKVSTLAGYHVMNNARVVRTSKGRIIVPAAHIEDGGVAENYEAQQCMCYWSDDDGVTWRASKKVSLDGHALMEPGVAECADGSFYMTIRTKLGKLYEARSRDHCETWSDFRATELPAPAAPSTVIRDPKSDDLWLFWCDRADAKWKQRSPQVFARSRDHGKTWSEPRIIEHDEKGSFGYISVTFVRDDVLLTYYDWRDHGQGGFEMTSLRQRTIPRGWFAGEVVPPVFVSRREPVLGEKGRRTEISGGLMVEKDRWRMWYNDRADGVLTIRYAESTDRGVSWKVFDASPFAGRKPELGQPSVHRVGDNLICYTYQYGEGAARGIVRFVSTDDGKTFGADPPTPLGFSGYDDFQIIPNDNGTWSYFAAPDKSISSALSTDGIKFTEPKAIADLGQSPGADEETIFGMKVFKYRRFFLGLLQLRNRETEVIRPYWAWSHNGVNWVRTTAPAIALGDERNFDCRVMSFGQILVRGDEVIWFYSGSDWTVRDVADPKNTTRIGRAVLLRSELDKWLDTLPQP